MATACAPLRLPPSEIPARHELTRYREHLAAERFDTVIQQSREVLQESETELPADLALYALGLVYANPAFPERNADLSRDYFAQLILHFPASPLVPEAKILVDLYDTIAALKESPALPRPLVEDRNFAEAARKNEQILRQAGTAPPADEALYNLGLISAHGDNPARDYQQARDYFAGIVSDFPASPRAEEARVWLGIFEVLEKMRQIDRQIEEQKKQLTR
ncbi:tol-pal system YbgF family protein [Desulfurivibrio sp. D14AmB]|uniref:tetratricopeptide repeat protein n=1 Tax=Desulfurivibrio sp. D14AmB TaxID=3374370 RepID=UPI00376EBA95